MTRARLRRLAWFASFAVLGAAASCVSSNNAAPGGGVDGGTFDAGGDASLPQRGDAAVADARAPSDAAIDAADGSPASPDDSGSTDANASGADSALDGGVDATDASLVDAAPTFDDSGCPIPTGVTLSPGDAGIPSAGLALWLRADVGLNTYGAAGDGGVVCRWDDVSGNDQSFTPASATPPTRVFGALGAAPAVSFNGSSQNLSRAGVLGIGATSARTVAVYAKTSDTNHRWEAFFQGVDGSPGTYFGLDANTYLTAGLPDGGGLEGVYVTDNSFDSDLATTTNARSHILSINSFAVGTTVPAALTYEVDGTLRTLTSRSGAGTVEDFSGANFTSVGYGASGFTGGVIGEVIVYDRELTPTERASVQQYFTGRY
jgi:hypothetical protein